MKTAKVAHHAVASGSTSRFNTMTDKFPNLPSDELAMLATVEAASNAGELTIIYDAHAFLERRLRLAALHSLVEKGWIYSEIVQGEYAFYTDRTKVFHADGEAYIPKERSYFL